MRRQSSGTAADELPATNLPRDLLLYTLARLGILVVSAGVLVLLHVPLLVAAAVAVVLVMPLSMVVFGSLRRRVATGIAQRTAARRERREQLRAQLRDAGGNSAGEDVTGENGSAGTSSEKHVTGEDAHGSERASGKDSTNEDEPGQTRAEGSPGGGGDRADAGSASRGAAAEGRPE